MRLKSIKSLRATLFVTAVALVAAIGISRADTGATKVEKPKTTEISKQIVVYYFHGNARCATCKTIERYTREALQEKFKGELKDGKLSMEVLNLDKSENEHFVKDYELVSRSVVISEMVNGKEKRWKRLDKVWDYVGTRWEFLKYIQSGVETYLSEKG